MEKWTAENIRSLRLRLGWSVADFARRFGSLNDLVNRWEAGEAVPTGQDRLQLEKLEFHLESSCDHMSRQPAAEQMLKTAGVEQIHIDVVLNASKEITRNQ